MEQNEFLYSDGREVFVTQSTLKTKGTLYHLDGVTDAELTVIKPNRIPGLIIFLMGLMIEANGFFHFIPYSFFESLSIPPEYVSSSILIIAGACLATIGIVLMLFMRKRYAVRIETAEGTKDAVVSKRKEYIDQVLHAIRKAKSFRFRRR